MRKIVLLMGILLISGIAQAQQNASNDEVKKWIARAKTAYSMGEYQDALEEYKKVQKVVPKFPEIYKNIAEVYEKLGTVNDLQEAIENYNKYLELSPKAQDRESIIEKIASIEYRTEKQAKQSQILDDLSGVWMSCNFDVSEMTANNAYSPIPVPTLVLRVTEVGKEGKFRIEIMSGCNMYRETIINKTAYVTPSDNNIINFVFYDEQYYEPSQSGYEWKRFWADQIGENLGFSDFTRSLVNTGINTQQMNDQPSSTQTVYNLSLRYENGTLKGYCNVVNNFRKMQTKSTKDNLFEIILIKEDVWKKDMENFKQKADVLTFSKGGLRLVDDWGNGEKLSNEEIKHKFDRINPKLWTRYRSAKVQENVGLTIAYGGLATMLTGLVVGTIDMYGTGASREIKDVSPTAWGLMGGGAGGAVVGIAVGFPATKKRITIVNEYNQAVSQETRRGAGLSFGVTTSGNVGLTLNF